MKTETLKIKKNKFGGARILKGRKVVANITNSGFGFIANSRPCDTFESAVKWIEDCRVGTAAEFGTELSIEWI